MRFTSRYAQRAEMDQRYSSVSPCCFCLLSSTMGEIRNGRLSPEHGVYTFHAHERREAAWGLLLVLVGFVGAIAWLLSLVALAASLLFLMRSVAARGAGDLLVMALVWVLLVVGALDFFLATTTVVSGPRGCRPLSMSASKHQ